MVWPLLLLLVLVKLGKTNPADQFHEQKPGGQQQLEFIVLATQPGAMSVARQFSASSANKPVEEGPVTSFPIIIPW